MRLSSIAIVVLMLAVAACQSDEEEPPVTSPTQTVTGKGPRSPMPTESPVITTATPSPTPVTQGNPRLEPLSVLGATLPASIVNDLRIRTGIRPEEIESATVAPAHWSDSCFDLSEPDTCTLSGAPSDGHRVTLRAGGTDYIYHTAGERRYLFAGIPNGLEAVTEIAKERLVGRGVSLQAIEVANIERVIWPSGCLAFHTGSDQAGPCPPPLGEWPGYRITLRAMGQEYPFRTDRLDQVGTGDGR